MWRPLVRSACSTISIAPRRDEVADAEGPKSTAILRHLRSADSGYDYVFSSASVLSLVPWREGAALARDHGETAERDEAIGLALSSAHLPRRARADVQQPRREAPHPDGSNNHDVPSVVAASAPRYRSSAGRSIRRSTGLQDALRSMWGASIATRVAMNSSRFSQCHAGAAEGAAARADRQGNAADYRSILTSATWAFWTTRTNSTHSLPPISW